MSIKLSACTIAKNEALNIGKSIDSYKEYVDEIIIVDTGSIDETAKIAEEKGAKVLHFEWKNDFAAAKNFALDNATGDWIIFLDADEWFDGDTAKNIKEGIKNAVAQNYNAVACKLVNFFTENEVMETASTIRVFKHADNIRFCRAIHEALFDINTNIALPGVYSELFTVNHSGYMKGLLAKKAKRNKMLLDRHFALGNDTPIDYFYGLRENLQENPILSDYFYNLIENTPNYDELVSTFNITTAIDETKIKLVNLLSNKYSFEYRVKLLDDIQKKHINNPTFKFYEYLLFEKTDKKRAINALQDAVEFEKKFEKDNIISNNPFYGKRSEAYAILGEYYLFINDKIKALEYFTQAVKNDYANIAALKGILYIISNEKTEDIVIFINSIFNIENKETEMFLVDALRVTEFKDVFLYYFVDYYKKYEEVDRAYFTSRLLTENFDEVIDRYIKVYKDTKDERAFSLVAAALIVGNSEQKFLEISNNLSYTYSKILMSYFNKQNMEQITENEIQVILSIFKEISYIANDDTINHFINICGSAKEKVLLEIIKYYYFEYSYERALKWINKAENENEISSNILLYINYLRANIYFRTNEFEKLPLYLEKVIAGGLLDQNVVFMCEMLEADDEKLQEYYELFDSYIFAIQNLPFENIEDWSSDSVKFMTIDKFEEEIKNKQISLFDEHSQLFFDFAEKLKAKKVFSIAEKYYKIAVKYNYKVDKAYFALGEIYNYFGKPELSFYCYENAFIENIVLAKEILPSGHANYDYIFSKKKEIDIDNCPVCGGESKWIKTYINIDDENLAYNEPMIKKYCQCKQCQHIFCGNDIVDKIYWGNNNINKVSNERISLAYDILENICEITDAENILDCSDDNREFETAAYNYGFDIEKNSSDKKFDVVFMGNLLNYSYKVDEILGKYIENMAQDGVIVFELYDEGNAFSKLADKPLWAKAKIKNVFSKTSIEVLFNKFDLHILQINIDKVNKGKIIVFAGK